MTGQTWKWLGRKPCPVRYGPALLLAVVAQLVRWPLDPPTLMPFITYMPFIVMSVYLTGLGPGLLTVGISCLESLYFATEPVGQLKVAIPGNWIGLAMLALSGVITCILVERLHQAREELRAGNQELAAVYANAPIALMLVDSELRVRKLNPLAARFSPADEKGLLGLRPGGAIGCLEALADPRGCGYGPGCSNCRLRLSILDTVWAGVPHEHVEAWIPVMVNGAPQRRCLLVSSGPLLFDSGSNIRALVCAQDITLLKRSELELRENRAALVKALAESEESRTLLQSALQEKTVLFREVHHRVKNNLAVISSILGMKADGTAMPEVRMALQESQQRLYSIAMIHEHLYGRDHMEKVNFAEYARQLVLQLYSALAPEPDRIQLDLDMEPVELGIDRAVPCALILNELLSNAFKHAFPGGRTGTVRTKFRQSEQGQLELTIADDGIGSARSLLEAGRNSSLGLRIVNILTRQLDGSLQQVPGSGTNVVLRFPAEVAAQK